MRKGLLGALARQRVLQDGPSLCERILSNGQTSTSLASSTYPLGDISCHMHMSCITKRHFRVVPASSRASEEAPEQGSASTAKNEKNSMDFPGGRVPFTDRLSFVGGAVSPSQPTSCYRTLDSTGACETMLGSPFSTQRCYLIYVQPVRHKLCSKVRVNAH